MATFRTGQELLNLGVKCRQIQKADDEHPAIWAIDEDISIFYETDRLAGAERRLITGAMAGAVAFVREVKKNFESCFRVVDPESINGKYVNVEKPELRHGHGPFQPCGLAFVVKGAAAFWHADNYRHHGGFIIGDRGRLPPF